MPTNAFWAEVQDKGLKFASMYIYAPIIVKPQGGGKPPTGNWLREPSSGWGFWHLCVAPGPQGRVFGMATILEDREKLEMSDLPYC